jgi:hypothetical protein
MTAMLANMLHNRVQRRAVTPTDFLQANESDGCYATLKRVYPHAVAVCIKGI